MSASVSIRFITAITMVLVSASALMASPPTDEVDGSATQVVSGIPLPHWGEGECRESFDVRMWPGAVVIWLEQENLRSLISDPETPEPERQALKRILAMQRAWRSRA